MVMIINKVKKKTTWEDKMTTLMVLKRISKCLSEMRVSTKESLKTPLLFKQCRHPGVTTNTGMTYRKRAFKCREQLDKIVYSMDRGR
jgi:hypothetical protein